MSNHVLHDGRMFYCPNCLNYLGETILRNWCYCHWCGINLNWGVLTKNKKGETIIKKDFKTKERERRYIIKKEKIVVNQTSLF